jgi:soluble lytic murein transglycosylase
MFSIKRIAGVAILAVAVVGPIAPAHAKKPSKKPAHSQSVNADDIFLALRDAARHEEPAKAAELAARLPNYALASYVDYYRLKPRLGSASASEIKDFLKRHDGSAIADRLRNDWLHELGYRRDWAQFDEQYPLFVLDDDTQVKCYALMSKAVKGQQVAPEARATLVSPKDYGEACRALIATLLQSGQFSEDDVWNQVRLAAEAGAAGMPQRIAAVLGVPEKAVTQAVERAALTLARGVGEGRAGHELFIIALGRTARLSVELAARAMSAAEAHLSARERQLGWAQIALQASLKLAPETLSDYWSKTGDAPLSVEGHQWRVRMALRAGDWKAVKAGIEAMPANLAATPVWTYWMGRALKAEGRSEESRRMFLSIADQVHFYGQLATEELGNPIVTPRVAAAPAPDEIAPMAANAGFKRAIKFYELGLRFEGNREWNWELRKMSEREHLAAAEFARRQNLLDRMVNTSDRTKSEYDFTQRFPSPFRDFMVSTTDALGLDVAWVYGLIRQESRFVMNAKSHVGASGLMQLMPATARFVARKIGLDNYRHAQVNEIDTNIRLGTNYLNMVLKDLDGSQLMASAAYNAGPGRPRYWRSTLRRTVEGAVFAESIPFSETRGYVKNVLSNATYYAALFEGKPQSLKARLGVVTPKGFEPTELP